MPDYILKFEKNVHTALWGEEQWLVSVHPSGPVTIANGPLAGKSLAEVCPDFPVLVKVIDAKRRLSVQVHPNERTAPATGGEPKTEMWCMLDDGVIYAGLKPGVRAGDVAAAVPEGSFENLMVKHNARKGDVFFIPGGLVHAIGDGVRLFELQQSSNTTYRLYDWGRVDAEGRPRELHVEKSLATIDYSLAAPVAQKEADCPFFSFRQIAVAGRVDMAGEKAYKVFFVEDGEAVASCEAGGVALRAGECALVPPGVKCAVESVNARLFVARAAGREPRLS